jgi:hypothetical protein
MAKAVVRKKTPIRKSNSSKTLEEKHIGSEVTDWAEVTERKVAECLRYYGYFYDYKDASRWALSWVKKYMSKKDATHFAAAEDWRVSPTLGALCKMMSNGAVFDEKRMEWIHIKIDGVIAAGKSKKEDTNVVVANFVRRSIQDILKEKTSDFIAEIELVIDNYYNGVYTDIDNYSVYNELKKTDAAYNTAKAVADYYTPLKAELTELITQKTPDLIEAYEKMPLKQRKEYLKLVTLIIDDAEKYMASKKAVRKTRAKKPVSASQQVSKVSYLKDSAEFKLTSIDPASVVGASEVYLFNSKYRTLIRLVSSARDGFTIKGTTIQNIDIEASGKKKLRKPEDFFTQAGNTRPKMSKAYLDIKTKPSEANGRINGETLIYKAFK